MNKKTVSYWAGAMLAPAVIILAMLVWPTPPQKHCGTVMKLEVTQAGEHQVIYYVPDLLRAVTKQVTPDEFYQIKEGQDVCFTLNQHEAQ